MAKLMLPYNGANLKTKKLFARYNNANAKIKSLYESNGAAWTKIFSGAITWTSVFHKWSSYTPNSHDNTDWSVYISFPAIEEDDVSYGYDYTFTAPLVLPAGSTVTMNNWLMESQGGNQNAYLLFDDIQISTSYVSSMGSGSVITTTTIATARTVSKVSCKITKDASSGDYLKAGMIVTFNINGESFTLNSTNTSDQ